MTTGDTAEARVSSRFRACRWCGVADIPRDVEWLWFESGRPVHPWCDPIWARISEKGKKQVRQMVRTVLRAG